MNGKVRFGILGTAKIALNKVVPAILQSEHCEVHAVASRSFEKSTAFSRTFDIPKSYGSYEDLLRDPEIDAVYIPLPNDLHVEWSIKAAEQGKHVLCEKPIALTAADVKKLIEFRDKFGVQIQEAFMVETHPSWIKVRELIKSGRIGKLSAITGFFSYFNDDTSNIRNKISAGGGALLDIGCYCIDLSRFIFEEEPRRVSALIDRDGQTGIDRLTSAILDFSKGHSTFTCSTQLVPYQRMQFFGSRGRIEVQIPFNIPHETPTNIFIDDGSDLYGENIERLEIPAADQYTIQADRFARSIRGDLEPAVSLESSFANMAVIEAVFRAAISEKWESPELLQNEV